MVYSYCLVYMVYGAFDESITHMPPPAQPSPFTPLPCFKDFHLHWRAFITLLLGATYVTHVISESVL